MTNSTKYGRIYPEVAIEALRALAERLSREHTALGESTREQLADALADLETRGFPPDEPIFLLRGQDEAAPAAVIRYAHEVREIDAPIKVEAEAIRAVADDMRKWEPRKFPD